jgi:hypothetical protein
MTNAIALTSTNRSAPGGVNMTRYREQKSAVSAQAGNVRRRDRNPAWNILTAPERKAERRHMTGIKIPTTMLAKKVYRRNNRGWKCTKRSALPSSRYVSRHQTIKRKKGMMRRRITEGLLPA